MIVSAHDLRRWRSHMGYTQPQAAAALGIGLRTYKRYERADYIKRVGKESARIPMYIGLAAAALLRGLDKFKLGMLIPSIRR